MNEQKMVISESKVDSFFKVLDRLIEVYHMRISLAAYSHQVPLPNAIYQPLADDLDTMSKALKNMANSLGVSVPLVANG